MKRQLEPEVMDGAHEAAMYDAMDHSRPNAAFVARLLELGAAGCMLDVGTGPSDIPLLIAQEFDRIRVVAIDRSWAMLTIAEDRCRESHIGRRVVLCLADAKRLPFPNATFDTVFSNTILHHLADPQPLFHEAWRVLKPGGVILVRDLYRPTMAKEAEELVRRYTGDESPEAQKLFRDSLNAALTPDELGTLLGCMSMTGINLVIDTDRHMSVQGRKQ